MKFKPTHAVLLLMSGATFYLLMSKTKDGLQGGSDLHNLPDLPDLQDLQDLPGISQGSPRDLPGIPGEINSDDEPEGFEDSVDERWGAADLRLVRVIQEKFLERPETPRQPLALKQVKDKFDPLLEGQWGQAGKLEKYFNFLKEGFFLECGAVDGETLSNTLLFEMRHNWTGVLIEANPATYQGIRDRHRNVYSLNVCLSPSSNPAKLPFLVQPRHNQVVKAQMLSHLGKGKTASQLQCLPLFSILLALGNPTVHYFSLDVEGAEEDVLRTVPWHKVDIKVLEVEFTHSDGKAIKAIMQKAGYTFKTEIGEDWIFVKNGYMP